MVNFIPDPDLQQILLPLLAHIPAAFSSPKAPPSLPPLLAPILRSRVEHLSFGNTPWLQLLTWGSAEDGERMFQHLLEQDYFFLQDGGARYGLKGFRRVDADTIHLAVDVDELGLRMKFLFVVNDDNGEDDGWKLMDMRLLEDAEEEERSSGNEEWSKSVAAAEDGFRSGGGVNLHEGDERSDRLRSLNMALGGGSGHFVLAGGSQPSSPTVQRSSGFDGAAEDDDDDYWAQYDDVDGDSSRGDEATSHHSASPTVSSAVPVSATSEDDYYSRYNTVQPALDNNDPEATPHPEQEPKPESAAPTSMPSSSSCHNRTLSSNTDVSTGSASSSPVRSNLSTPLTVQTTTNTATADVVAKLERQAEQNVQAETAIKQHVATNMKSLYRLWRAAGLEREDFESMISREVEMLAMMEEDDGSFGSS